MRGAEERSDRDTFHQLQRCRMLKIFISASAMVILIAWTNYVNLGLLMTHS